jgi:hypothetical protein
MTNRPIGSSRLAAALAACAQLSALPASQRMWSLQSLRRLMSSSMGGSLASLNIPQVSQQTLELYISIKELYISIKDQSSLHLEKLVQTT